MPKKLLPAIVATAALLAACGSSSSHSSTPAAKPATTAKTTPTATTAQTSTTPTAKSQLSFENVPIEQGAAIAPASSTGTGKVDNLIQCLGSEQLAYHIHVHLAVFFSGQPRALPGGIGIPGSQVQQTPTAGPEAIGGSCIYYLHTHAPDGVIHIESPTQRIYTLGQFFDEWHQPLSRTQIGSIHGTAAWIVNGKPWTKDPRAIPLTPHAVIQASVGRPAVAFAPLNWASTQL
ncbi:MAG: hypothetical protein ACYDHH_13015 [Solirubrobacteraceae bacterium]